MSGRAPQHAQYTKTAPLRERRPSSPTNPASPTDTTSRRRRSDQPAYTSTTGKRSVRAQSRPAVQGRTLSASSVSLAPDTACPSSPSAPLCHLPYLAQESLGDVLASADPHYFSRHQASSQAHLRNSAHTTSSSQTPASPQDPETVDKEPLCPPASTNLGILARPQSASTQVSFIRNALNLCDSRPPIPTKQYVKLGGNVRAVRLFDFFLDKLPIGDDGRISWPSQVNGVGLDRIDGVIVLYEDAIQFNLDPAVSRILTALRRSEIPTALVALRREFVPITSQLESLRISAHAAPFKHPLTLRASIRNPESARLCLEALLETIPPDTSTERPSTPSSFLSRRSQANPLSTRTQSLQKESRDGRHSRSTSEYSVSSLKKSHPDTEIEQLGRKRSVTLLQAPSRLPNPRLLVPDGEAQRPRTAKPRIQRDLLRMLSIPGSSDGTLPQSFLMDDSPAPESRTSTDSDNVEQCETVVTSPSTAPLAYSFEDLIAMLLIAPQSKGEFKFTTTFLAFYRLFAPPLQLLQAIIEHFESIKDPDVFMKYRGSPGRDLLVLEQWMSSYPGDFAFPPTRRRLRIFLQYVREDLNHLAMAKHMLSELENIVEDDDTHWANNDAGDPRPATAQTFLSTSSASSPNISPASFNLSSAPDSNAYPSETVSSTEDTSPTSTLTLNAMCPASNSSSQTIAICESAQREAAKLVPRTLCIFGKSQWRSFMAQPEEYIARELTRMDWIMFTAIRPRDLVRHVFQSPETRHSFPGTENVGRMIEHFNHLAYFVTNVVLFRDKPKHRALALDKLMRVARELRKMNNYNGLGALVAGIKGSAVHRLAATWDCVSEDRKKDFLKLEILMSTSRAHSAYRLAWENSFGERIPFIPLHRKDLVIADQGNKTFIERGADAPVDSARKINWRKFELLGDTLAGVQNAQATSYSGFVVHDEVRSLVLGCDIIKDDDLLYERSVALEAGAFGNEGLMKKRLNWLRGYGLS